MGPVLIGVFCELRIWDHNVFAICGLYHGISHINGFDKSFLAIR